MEEFIHPCERQIFVDILNILKYLNEVVRFAKYFGGINPNDISDFMEVEGNSIILIIHFVLLIVVHRSQNTHLDIIWRTLPKVSKVRSKTITMK